MSEGERQQPVDARPGAWTPPGSAWSNPSAAPAPGAEGSTSSSVLGGPARPVGDEPTSPVQLRPTSASALYDGAFEVLRVRPMVLLGAAAVLVLPTQVVSMWARGGPYSGDLIGWATGLADGGLDTAGDTRPWALWASGALELTVTFLVGAVVAAAVSSWYAGRDPGVRDVLRTALRRPGALLVALILAMLAKGTGSLVFCVGLLVPLAWYCPLAPALVVEQLSGVAAMRRSYQLVSRRLFNVIGVVVGMALVDQVVRFSLTTVPWLLADGLPDLVTTVVRGAVVVAVAIVSSVFIGAASTLVYFDLRVRTEGLDLELEATDALAPPA